MSSTGVLLREQLVSCLSKLVILKNGDLGRPAHLTTKELSKGQAMVIRKPISKETNELLKGLGIGKCIMTDQTKAAHNDVLPHSSRVGVAVFDFAARRLLRRSWKPGYGTFVRRRGGFTAITEGGDSCVTASQKLVTAASASPPIGTTATSPWAAEPTLSRIGPEGGECVTSTDLSLTSRRSGEGERVGGCSACPTRSTRQECDSSPIPSPGGSPVTGGG